MSILLIIFKRETYTSPVDAPHEAVTTAATGAVRCHPDCVTRRPVDSVQVSLPSDVRRSSLHVWPSSSPLALRVPREQVT